MFNNAVINQLKSKFSENPLQISTHLEQQNPSTCRSGSEENEITSLSGLHPTEENNSTCSPVQKSSSDNRNFLKRNHTTSGGNTSKISNDEKINVTRKTTTFLNNSKNNDRERILADLQRQWSQKVDSEWAINIVKELKDTEKTYLENLKTLQTVYCAKFESQGFRETKNISTIFNNLIEEIKKFLNDLINSDDDELEKIGQIFLDHEQMFQRYIDYFSTMKQNQSAIEQNKTIMKAAQALQAKMYDSKSIIDYLKMPLQRLSNYKLILEKLVKETRNHPIPTLNSALQKINNHMSEANNAVAIESIVNCEFPLKEYKPFLFKNRFKCLKPKSAEYTVFLFEKIVIITKRQKDKNKFDFKDYIRIKDLMVYRGQDSLTFEFLDTSRTKKSNTHFYKFEAETSEIRNNWMDEIIVKIQNQFDEIRNGGNSTTKIRVNYDDAYAPYMPDSNI